MGTFMRRNAISRGNISITAINHVTSFILASLALLSLSAPVSAQVQFHGASIQKEPLGPHNTPMAHIGDPIRAVIRVRNDDSASHPLVITSIVDVVHHGSGDTVSPNLLSGPVTLANTGDFIVVTNTYIVKPGDAPLLTDDAQAGGYDTGGGANEAQNFFITSAAQVKIISPAISITANCISLGTPQNPLAATFGVVSNAGDIVLSNVVITDQRGFLRGITSLQPSQTAAYSNVYVPTASAIVMSVVGWDPLIGKSRFSVVSNTASCTVPGNCTPGIQVFKYCGPFDPSDSSLMFTGLVVNTGEVPLTDVRVYNDRPAPNTLVFGPASLAPGASASFAGKYGVPQGICVISDKLVAVGMYSSACAGTGSVQASAMAECPVSRPGQLVVRRDCPAAPTALGQPMRISGIVSNAGPIAIGNLTIADSSGAPVSPPGISNLAPGQSISFTLTIVPTNCGPVTGTITAKGLNSCSEQEVIAQATSTCQMICGTAQICLTKSVVCSTSNGCENVWAPTATGFMRTEPAPGRCPDFCYRFAITNCGTVALTNIALVDSEFDLTTVALPASLAPGEGTVIYLTNINHCVSSTNIAMVSGQSAVNGAIVTAQSTARVEIRRAAITCEKIVNSPDAIDGTPNDNYLQLPDDGRSHEVTFSVRVTNTGDVDLRDISITDEALAERGIVMPARFSLATGQTTNFTLCQLSFRCSNVRFTNTVQVRGEVEIGTNTFCLWDSEDQRSVNASSTCQAVIECRTTSMPRICVSKQVMCSTSNGCASVWGTSAIGIMRSEPSPGRCPDFCYRFAVTNCGTVTLSNISLTDSHLNLSGVALPRTLAPGAGAVVFVTNVNHCTSATNTVTARGTASGTVVTATATASVRVIRAAIECEKIVNSPDAIDGTPNDSYLLLPKDGRSHPVTFSVRVTNTGDVDLRDVTITDAWLSGRNISMPAPFRLAVGQTTNITLCQISLSCTGMPITNTISVRGNINRGTNLFCLWDSVDRRDVYARSACQAVIDCRIVVTPAITLSKYVTCASSNGCGASLGTGHGNHNNHNGHNRDDDDDDDRDRDDRDRDHDKSKTRNGNPPAVLSSTWSHSAFGIMRSEPAPGRCPDFCYAFAITNTGNVTLSNLLLIDDKLDLSSLRLPRTLAPGAGVVLVLSDVNHCTNSTNTATIWANSVVDGAIVTASDSAEVRILRTAIQCELKLNSPDALDATPDDNYLQLPSDGDSHRVSYSICVRNTGDVDLRNISVSSSSLSLSVPTFSLRAGQMTNFALRTSSVRCTSGVTNHISVRGEVVTGTNRVCLWDEEDGRNVYARSSCAAVIECQRPTPPPRPQLCVQKTVVCGTLPCCGVDWQKIATGVKTHNESFCPSFCFRITVTNCGPIAVTDLTVTDNKLNLSGAGSIPSTLAPGAGFELIVTNATYCRTTTNVVTVVARGGGTSISASDHAIARVRQASLECQQMLVSAGVHDPDPTDSFVRLPDDGASHNVDVVLRVSNTGDVDLNVAITDPVLAHLSCTLPAPFVLAAGQTVTLPLCTVALGCANLPWTNTAIVAATVVSGDYCAFDARHGESVSLNCRSESTVVCGHPDNHGCRVTGGGKVKSTLPLVRFATHGGQVGAPSSGHGVFDPDSACIEGNWQHVRHGTGGQEGNFHAKSFDSLLCACLSCDGGAGNVVGRLCNPGDRTCGPEPRRAPANKIAFSGIGDYRMSKGRRNTRTVLYRVDVEDRGEPGGAHAGGGSAPADRYRIRIWILTSAELARLNNANDRLLEMRQAVSASAQNTALIDGAVRSDGVTPVALGTAVFGVRAPDIDDGGELDTGNQQIHPVNKECRN